MKQNQNSDESIDENMSVDNTETCMVDTVKATAIFWIDKNQKSSIAKNMDSVLLKLKYLSMKTEKSIFSLSSKKQSTDLEKYILHHLDKFQISKRMLEGGYIQTGEQFVQLRCMWGKN